MILYCKAIWLYIKHKQAKSTKGSSGHCTDDCTLVNIVCGILLFENTGKPIENHIIHR